MWKGKRREQVNNKEMEKNIRIFPYQERER